jgi:hypothetical protein
MAHIAEPYRHHGIALWDSADKNRICYGTGSGSEGILRSMKIYCDKGNFARNDSRAYDPVATALGSVTRMRT